MSELVKYENGALVAVTDPEPGALAVRDGGSLVGPVDPTPVADPSGHRPRRMAIAVIAAAILAAVAAGAAVFSSGPGAATAAGGTAAHGDLAASASTSAAARTAAFTVTATRTSPGSVTTLVSGKGSVDLTKGVGQMEATIPAMATIVGGGTHDSTTVISDGKDVYVNLPALSSVTGGKSWLEASVASAASMSGVSASSSALSALADPSKLLGYLGSLSGKVTKVGTVELGGVQTTEYQTTITAADLAARIAHNGTPSATSRAAANALQDLGLPSIPVQAWVGGDGMLRQISVSIDLKHATVTSALGLLGSSLSGSAGAGGSNSGSDLTVTVGLSHYGAPVSITVPPASDVTNLNDAYSSLHGVFSKVGNALSGIVDRV